MFDVSVLSWGEILHFYVHFAIIVRHVKIKGKVNNGMMDRTDHCSSTWFNAGRWLLCFQWIDSLVDEGDWNVLFDALSDWGRYLKKRIRSRLYSSAGMRVFCYLRMRLATLIIFSAIIVFLSVENVVLQVFFFHIGLRFLCKRAWICVKNTNHTSAALPHLFRIVVLVLAKSISHLLQCTTGIIWNHELFHFCLICQQSRSMEPVTYARHVCLLSVCYSSSLLFAGVPREYLQRGQEVSFF